ncbi:hypothetical protein TGVAND_289273 [Toxoplasma gondii VAND]|uniref:Uncharacterized protein n=1 Tax=Toxoplasma gondii VAND TaxID=933077 RepID=A0A086Q8I0_TOXGO|nr:hypothetical protein TGVAND_289273 [Toxoplasma gondii VAND]
MLFRPLAAAPSSENNKNRSVGVFQMEHRVLPSIPHSPETRRMHGRTFADAKKTCIKHPSTWQGRHGQARCTADETSKRQSCDPRNNREKAPKQPYGRIAEEDTQNEQLSTDASHQSDRLEMPVKLHDVDVCVCVKRYASLHVYTDMMRLIRQCMKMHGI